MGGSYWDHFPQPVSTPTKITVENLHEVMQMAMDDHLVVDVRRADIQEENPYMIPGAINLPAHTFHATLPTLYPILSRFSGVVFHCGSSTGRGPRCAGWYQDELNRRGEKGSQAFVLEGGIKKWKEVYPDEILQIPPA